jgi:hypothetical protein
MRSARNLCPVLAIFAATACSSFSATQPQQPAPAVRRGPSIAAGGWILYRPSEDAKVVHVSYSCSPIGESSFTTSRKEVLNHASASETSGIHCYTGAV